MTNNEILKADLIDILFENRNKAYGAYAIRKSYDATLLRALFAGLSVAVLFVLAGRIKSPDKSVALPAKKDSIVVRTYVIPQKKIEQPVQQKQEARQKAAVKTAKVKFTSRIDIRKDDQVKTAVTTVENLSDKTPGDDDSKGKPDDGTVKAPDNPGTGKGNGDTDDKTSPVNFIAQERNAEFPGGPEALHRYLSKNLRTPDDLESGEKKVVKVRFRVDIDGTVNGFEVVSTGGRDFDDEVLRVCKKMPRWEPALQNGINVPVFYMIPVTFVGAE